MATVSTPSALPSSSLPPPADPSVRIVPRRHAGRTALAVAALLAVAAAVNSLARNRAFQWDVVGSYVTSGAVLDGLWLTLWLTAVVTGLGLLLGTVLAAMRLSQNAVLRGLAWGWVWLFRSVPPLVQLIFWFNIGALYPTLSLGVPLGPAFFHVKTVNLLGGVATAVIGLTLNESAYAAEIVRGGLLAVEQGQVEAATALGLSRWRTLRRIVLPQAMRAIVPPAGNLLIGTLKGTAIVSVLAVQDLLYSVQIIYLRTYQVIPLLVVATLWYLVVTSVLTVAQFYVERHFARGASRELPPTPLQRARNALASARARVRRATATDAPVEL
ncbi:amino acid ABC transporter permease [Streptacidiphilus monticola]|uniref:Amino acid ABC transporter permease n=1 Tax=Streptacidiphilus monticola TaxID=2161674 RepID=A0ABW1G7U3_9ACTN